MDNNYLKVENKEHLYRNKENNSIVNADFESYKIYEELYRKKYAERERLNMMEGDINNIKSDLNEIKNLLRKLANES